jgi:hypothetical protein
LGESYSLLQEYIDPLRQDVFVKNIRNCWCHKTQFTDSNLDRS